MIPSGDSDGDSDSDKDKQNTDDINSRPSFRQRQLLPKQVNALFRSHLAAGSVLGLGPPRPPP
jgi:hypothetical protein